MTALGLLAVALLGAAPLDAAAPAGTAHVHAVITPARPHLVLGSETEMTLEIEVRDNESGVTFAPERALASIGTIASMTASGDDDHFVAGHEDKPGSGKIELQRVYGMRQPRRSLRRNGGTR